MAELQHLASGVEGQRPLLTRIDVNAGHGAGMPTEKIIQQMVDIWGFVAKVTDSKCV
jgi:prolyl oligopeptidase